MHSHWADTGTAPPGPSSGLAPTGLLSTQGRFPAPLYTSSGLGYPRTRLLYPGNGPYRRPRVVIPVDMGVPLPDHPQPVGAPAKAPLNMNSLHSNNPQGGANFIPLSNGTYYIWSGTPILRAELAGNQVQQARKALNYMGHQPPTMGDNSQDSDESVKMIDPPRHQDCEVVEAQASLKDGKPRCPTPFPENSQARGNYIPGLSPVDEGNLRVKLKRKADSKSGLGLWIAETKSLKQEGTGAPGPSRATDSPSSQAPNLEMTMKFSSKRSHLSSFGI